MKHWKYRIAKSTDVRKVVDSAMTLDAAFHRAAELSKDPKHYGAVFVAYDPAEIVDDIPRFRLFAQAGVSRWARACTAKVYSSDHYGCRTCGGLGLIEDCPS